MKLHCEYCNVGEGKKTRPLKLLKGLLFIDKLLYIELSCNHHFSDNLLISGF